MVFTEMVTYSSVEHHTGDVRSYLPQSVQQLTELHIGILVYGPICIDAHTLYHHLCVQDTSLWS